MGEGSSSCMRILVIEDTEDVAEGIIGAVHRMGHETDWARDGGIADDLLSAYSYDLVLLDLMLPKLDGVTLLRRVRDRRDDVPVLVLTALSLLEMLLSNRGHILSKRQILDGVFGYETEPTENAVEVLVGRLRRKIVGTTAHIHNHRGLGYQLLDQ